MTLNACLRPPKALLPLLALACVVVVLPVRAAPPPAAALPPEAAASASTALPIVLRARSLRARPDLDASAEGDVELRRGPLWLRADRLDYDVVEDLAWARGQVRVQRGDVVYRGPELQLRLDRFEGFFLQPEFDLLRLQSGGWAERVDFLGRSRALATRVAYTSCPREDAAELPWVLQADRLRMDFEANEGIAEGGVLRFMDVPILALPALSFPLTDARKSGWLPPTINLDTRSGLDLSVPYYWNLAPNRDATLTPRLITRRGFGLDSEFRYLEPGQRGELQVDLLPQDRIAGRSRHALRCSTTARARRDCGWRVTSSASPTMAGGGISPVPPAR